MPKQYQYLFAFVVALTAAFNALDNPATLPAQETPIAPSPAIQPPDKPPQPVQPPTAPTPVQPPTTTRPVFPEATQPPTTPGPALPKAVQTQQPPQSQDSLVRPQPARSPNKSSGFERLLPQDRPITEFQLPPMPAGQHWRYEPYQVTEYVTEHRLENGRQIAVRRPVTVTRYRRVLAKQDNPNDRRDPALNPLMTTTPNP